MDRFAQSILFRALLIVHCRNPKTKKRREGHFYFVSATWIRWLSVRGKIRRRKGTRLSRDRPEARTKIKIPERPRSRFASETIQVPVGSYN